MSSIETNAPVLIIGYGNPLRGDDAAGRAAARRLRRHLSPENAEVLIVHQLLPELSDRISRSRLTIFIDADWAAPVGAICRRDLTAGHDNHPANCHYQSPENLLAMAGDIFGHTPQGILFQIGAADFRFRRGLSDPVRKSLRKLLNLVLRVIDEAAPVLRHEYV